MPTLLRPFPLERDRGKESEREINSINTNENSTNQLLPAFVGLLRSIQCYKYIIHIDEGVQWVVYQSQSYIQVVCTRVHPISLVVPDVSRNLHIQITIDAQ